MNARTLPAAVHIPSPDPISSEPSARAEHISTLDPEGTCGCEIVRGAVRAAVRRHAPLPRETVTIDFGDFGEIEVELEIDAGDDSDVRGAATYFHVHSVFRNGKDFEPMLRELLGAEAWREFEGVVQTQIERRAA